MVLMRATMRFAVLVAVASAVITASETVAGRQSTGIAVKAAIAPDGYDVQICPHCSDVNGPRIAAPSSGVATAQDEEGGFPVAAPPPEPLGAWEPIEDPEPPRESPRDAQLNALVRARSFTDAQKGDVAALWDLLDDAVEGKDTVNDLALSWVGHDVLREGDVVFAPFTVTLDPARTGGSDVWISWRVVPKPAASGARIELKDLQPVFEDVSVVSPSQAPGGRIIRSFAAAPGEYDLFIVARDVTPTRRGAPSPKASVVKQPVSVPDLGTGLTTSSVIVPATITRLSAPLSPRERIERPYAIGVSEVVPATTTTFDEDGNLSLFFLIYNPASGADGKPALTVDYTFHIRQPGGEQVFNKTVPQILNATTLPAEFDPAQHQLQASQVVPLTSFPPGDYRLQITITDAVATTSIARDVLFTVTGG
jgi:hypothetical protein